MVALTLTEAVDAPKATPPQSGLIAAADKVGRLTIETTESKWAVGGLAYLPEAAGPGAKVHSVLDFDNEGSDAMRAANVDMKVGNSANGSQAGVISGYPILLVTEETHSSIGFTAANYEERARRRLEAIQSKLLEWEFWTGEVAQLDGLDPAIYQWLAQSRVNAAAGPPAIPAHGTVDITPGGGAVDPKHALGLLEQALGEEGIGSGFIHMTRQMGILMPDRWSDGPLITWPDSVVVPGAGYPGTGPNGATPAAGESWVYATDLCDVRLGPVSVFPDSLDEALDRSKNTVSFRAERFAVVTWDGYAHYAVRTTI